jgi:hypothetical protein
MAMPWVIWVAFLFFSAGFVSPWLCRGIFGSLPLFFFVDAFVVNDEAMLYLGDNLKCHIQPLEFSSILCSE